MNRNYKREALQLYREVLKTCKVFYWSNEQGSEFPPLFSQVTG